MQTTRKPMETYGNHKKICGNRKFGDHQSTSHLKMSKFHLTSKAFRRLPVTQMKPLKMEQDDGFLTHLACNQPQFPMPSKKYGGLVGKLWDCRSVSLICQNIGKCLVEHHGRCKTKHGTFFPRNQLAMSRSVEKVFQRFSKSFKSVRGI